MLRESRSRWQVAVVPAPVSTSVVKTPSLLSSVAALSPVGSSVHHQQLWSGASVRVAHYWHTMHTHQSLITQLHHDKQQ